LSWIGIGLTLPYYGGEAYGLHTIGQEALTAAFTSIEPRPGSHSD
jgi:hypothetical protein